MANDRLKIDVDARRITIPDTESIFGVYQDRNAERKYFECPRYIGDNIDILDCFIFINYVSVGGNNGKYMVEDIVVDEETGNVVFSWLLTGNVFDDNKDGWVRFAVKIETTSGVSVLNTTPASGLVKSTIEDGEFIEEEYPDIILQLVGRKKTVTLPLNAWIQSPDATYYTQEVTVDGATIRTRVDLDPTAEQIIQLLQEEVSMFVVNEEGSITVYAVNNTPSTDFTIDMILKEVL